MKKDIVPGPNSMLFKQPTAFELGSPSRLPIPCTEPGDIADSSGDLWLSAFGDRLAHGEMPVTFDQAQAAAQHGWETVPGSECDGRVTVQRPDLNPKKK
ncbi:hypothetical protein MMSR116_27445 [Methylobacterium mesophilicum SR1.6/6]|uniref:Uncharacterized protein n=1 Tax=Methylobacterium mesophilicum SR1.6/6 TaxID=908290 RepID=A0A6B9FWN2_9HYPH|nr:hypothetical protein [Methylobacterium mesophilicum]QGY05218.1 hypothetical protein MMSR116_27445 [Methylobacterium mesophilicum SR1.6/6]